MAKAEWCGEQVYRAAQTFGDSCLRRDASLFSAGASLWTLENAGGCREVRSWIACGHAVPE